MATIALGSGPFGTRRAFVVRIEAVKNPHTPSNFVMTEEGTLIAVYESHAEVGCVLHRLLQMGAAKDLISIAGRSYRTEPRLTAVHRDGPNWRYFGRFEAHWNRLWDELAGGALVCIPSVGPVVVAGPLASMLIQLARAGAATEDLDVFSAALHTLGIPPARVDDYAAAVRADALVLLVQSDVHHIGPVLAVIREAKPLEAGAYLSQRNADREFPPERSD